MTRRVTPMRMTIGVRTQFAGIVYFDVGDPSRAKPVTVRVPRSNTAKPSCLTHNNGACEHCTAVLLYLVDHDLPPLTEDETPCRP